MKKKTKDYKKCPRCKEKLDISAPLCPFCQLKFNKLELATNKAAKVAFKQKRKHHVIYVNKRPSDVPKFKFVLSLIFGWLGIHNIYLGKYVKGWLSFASFFTFLISYITLGVMMDKGAITTEVFNGINYYLLSNIAILFAVMLIFWLDDIVLAIIGKFKFPVSIPKETQIEAIINDSTPQNNDKSNNKDNTSNNEVIVDVASVKENKTSEETSNG